MTHFTSPTTRPRRLIRELPLSQQPAYRLRRAGADSLSMTELLAIVLNTPDAFDLAQELISRFPPDQLPHMTINELTQLTGIGKSVASVDGGAATQLLAAFELGRRLMMHTQARETIKNPADAAHLLMPQLRHKQEEHFVVCLLNMKSRVLDTIWLYKGTVNSSVIRIGEVFQQAIRRCATVNAGDAAAILVAHNHPSGDPTPSVEDIRVTRDLKKAGLLLDIELLDHVVIGDGRFVSMKERGLGF